MEMRTSLSYKHFLLVFLAGLLSLHAESLPRPSRIAPSADLTATASLTGYVPAWVSNANRVGAVADDTPIRVTLLLSRAPQDQMAFQQLLEEQQSPSSAQYRHWLTPLEIGARYGPAMDEIEAISRWVRSQGLQVSSVSPTRTSMEVAGPSARVASALKVTLGRYQVNGRTRVAPATEPAIPQALSKVISGVAGLTELTLQPATFTGPVQTMQLASEESRSSAPRPLYTDPNTGVHSLTPGDFATIYDVVGATGAGYDGRGVRVAVLGKSHIVDSDITELEYYTGVPQRAPTTVVVPNSDPGIVLEDQYQSTFEVGRVLTTAPGADVDLIIAGASSGGIAAALRYNLDVRLDPVMSISYSDCETMVSPADVALYDGLFAQAAAEGISTFVTAGSTGAAGCSNLPFTAPTDSEFKAMGNFLCSSSYVTCVGATEFAEAGNDSMYWSGTNASGTLNSAQHYIPEGAWNDSVYIDGGTTVYQIAGTGSGTSAYIAKPSWQTGLGVPNNAGRNIPDIAFSGAEHDAYFGCFAALGADCAAGKKLGFAGGPGGPGSMAGIAAILGQRLARQPQAGLGNINPMLYLLAATTPAAFHDVTPLSSSADCTSTTPNLCNNSTAGPSSPTGGLAGDTLQVGYDTLTGLGSLDVSNFVNAAALLPPPSATSLAIAATPTTVAAGQQVSFTATLSPSGAGTPTGNVYIYFNGQPVAVGSLHGNIVSGLSASFATPGVYTVSAAYPGDLNFAGSITDHPVQIAVTPAPVAVSGFLVQATPSSIQAGQSVVFTATVSGNPTPSGTVQFFSNGTAVGGAVALSGGVGSTSAVTFPTAGTYAITATYSGDANFTSATSQSLPFVVAAVPVPVPSFVITASPGTVIAGQSAVFMARLTGSPLPSGTVQFYSNGASLGSAVQIVNGVATTPAVSFPTAGTYTITATYSGDASYAFAIAPGLAFVVTPGNESLPGISLTSSPSAIVINSGATSGNSSTVKVQAAGGFSGLVSLSCAVTSVSGTVTGMPLCSVTPSSITLAANDSATSVVSIGTSLTKAASPSGQLASNRNDLGSPMRRLSLALLLALLIPASRRRAVRARLGRLPALVVSLAFLLLGAATVTGCGGTVGTVLSSSGTGTGLYNVTVTASGTGVSATTMLSLTVK